MEARVSLKLTDMAAYYHYFPKSQVPVLIGPENCGTCDEGKVMKVIHFQRYIHEVDKSPLSNASPSH